MNAVTAERGEAHTRVLCQHFDTFFQFELSRKGSRMLSEKKKTYYTLIYLLLYEALRNDSTLMLQTTYD